MAITSYDRIQSEQAGTLRRFVQRLTFDAADTDNHDFLIRGAFGYTVVGLMVYRPGTTNVLVEVFGAYDSSADVSDAELVFSSALASYNSDGAVETGDNILASVDTNWNGITFRNYWFPYLIVRGAFDAVAATESMEVYLALLPQE